MRTAFVTLILIGLMFLGFVELGRPTVKEHRSIALRL
jgi:hypothetical protein